MFQHRILKGLLIGWLAFLMIAITQLSANAACVTDEALASYERASIQASGQVMHDSGCTDACTSEAAEAVAAYDRASLQAQGQVMSDVIAVVDTSAAIAAYQRAEMQAQGRVMTGPSEVACASELAPLWGIRTDAAIT